METPTKFVKLMIPVAEAVRAKDQNPNMSLTQAVIHQLITSNNDNSRGATNEPTNTDS